VHAPQRYVGAVTSGHQTRRLGQIKEIRRKVEAAFQTILVIAGDKELRGIQIKTIWNLVEACIINEQLKTNLKTQINGITLEVVNKSKFLGVIIDDQLYWKHHILYTSKKIAKAIGIISIARRVFNKTNLNNYIMLLCTHI
jgi:hypothetical protein